MLGSSSVCPLKGTGGHRRPAEAGAGPAVEHADPSAAHGAGRFAPEPRRVTQVVLVGGATRMPAIREFVATLTGIQPQA